MIYSLKVLNRTNKVKIVYMCRRYKKIYIKKFFYRHTTYKGERLCNTWRYTNR